MRFCPYCALEKIHAAFEQYGSFGPAPVPQLMNNVSAIEATRLLFGDEDDSHKWEMYQCPSCRIIFFKQAY